MKLKQNETPQLNVQAKLLRARIDSEVGRPMVILVTSAERNDGADLTAAAIAGAFAGTGVRTVLFNATSNVQRGWRSDAHVNVSKPELLHSREQLVDFVASLRSSYEITIIEAPSVMEDDTANALIAVADVALVSIRLGREAGDGDILLSRILERTEGCVLGIVTTDPNAIEEFEAVPPNQHWPLPQRVDVQDDASPINQSIVRRILTGIFALAFITLAGSDMAESSQHFDRHPSTKTHASISH